MVFVLLAGLVALAGWMTTWPSTDPQARVDAVLVLAGGTVNADEPGNA
jgi:hypothetical protein